MSTKLLIGLVRNLTLQISNNRVPVSRICVNNIHTTCRKLDLMEFFEDKDNWGKEEIRVGRSWKVDELRIKSNEDLHKLWYVLLKENNMLLTMELHCKTEHVLFPNPERIDKIKESMKNVETVVRERNKAYYELETGETGERPAQTVRNRVGMKSWYKLGQHYVPKFANTFWKKYHEFGYDHNECDEFLRLLTEKYRMQARGRRKLKRRYVAGLLRRFPNVDKEHLQELYPDINIKRLEDQGRTAGHYLPK